MNEVYGVSSDVALGWALAFHVLTFIPVTVVGVYYFTRLGLHFRDLSSVKPGGAKSSPDSAA